MFHLGGADTEGQGSEGSVGGGMGVAAYQSYPRNGDAQLRAYDMHNALPFMAETVERDIELLTVIYKSLHLNPAQFSAGSDVRGGGGYVVIHGSPGAFRTADLSVMKSQSGKGLRAGNFMKEVSVHVEDGEFAFLSADDM